LDEEGTIMADELKKGGEKGEGKPGIVQDLSLEGGKEELP